jgi:hypothetical protein
MYRLLADTVVLVHLAFVAFVVAGGFLVFRWPRVAWLHLPAAVWGALIEFMGWVCPLTPLEQQLRNQAGEAGYHGDFVTHYLLPFLYPEHLTPALMTLLGLLVVAVNGIVYTLVIRQAVRRHGSGAGTGPGR